MRAATVDKCKLKSEEIQKNTLNISSIKFKMWPASFSVNSLNFQQWNSNSHMEFSCLGLRLYFSIFPNSLKYWKLRYNFAVVGLHNFSNLWKWWNNGIFECYLRLYFQISPNSIKSWKIDIVKFHLLSYVVRL